MKYVLLIIGLLITTHSSAIVDMKNANYADTWIDLVAPGAGYHLQVRRVYNSRSLFNGIHGFGWCSDFETQLEVTAEGNLRLTECGGGLEVEFTPRNFSQAEVDKTVNRILAAHKKEKPATTNKALLQLKLRLKEDPRMRSRLAQLHGIKVPIQPGTKFYANGKEVEHIELKKNEYVRHLANNTIQKFNLKGKMTFVSDKNNNFLKFKYNKSQRLQVVSDNNGRQLSFQYYQTNQKVKSIAGPNGLMAVYKYKGDDVVEVTNAWKHTYKYGYDDLHNLVSIRFPDGQMRKMTYNKNKDWITSFTDRDGCVESYKYVSRPKDPKNNYVSTVTKKCGKKTVISASYEFWHKKRDDGLKYLHRVKTIHGAQVTDITYHPYFGRPMQIRKNGIDTKFGYYPNGLVKTKEISSKKGIERVAYEYKNKYKKVSKVIAAHYNLKGKRTRQMATAFKYNKRANLAFAKTSDGQSVWLSYDVNGRIARIKDQTKKTVNIKYEDRFGKPSYVERPGTGSINVSYKPNGEIKKVKSKQGPEVAVQVANIFNNLLGIISPATDGLSL